MVVYSDIMCATISTAETDATKSASQRSVALWRTQSIVHPRRTTIVVSSLADDERQSIDPRVDTSLFMGGADASIHEKG